jgi:hypothetical protein
MTLNRRVLLWAAVTIAVILILLMCWYDTAQAHTYFDDPTVPAQVPTSAPVAPPGGVVADRALALTALAGGVMVAAATGVFLLRQRP